MPTKGRAQYTLDEVLERQPWEMRIREGVTNA